jgi:uncharacterized protein YkwD
VTRRTNKAVAIVATMLAGAGAALIAPQAAHAAPVSAATLQTQVVKLSNTARVKAGCKALPVNDKLLWAARGHSKHQAKTKTMTHTGTGGSTFITRAQKAGYHAARSENVAYGYRSADKVVNAWLASPGHRKNLLDCRAKTFAVGVVYASNGAPYYTQVFGSR